jgi:hypothetical protein
MIATCSVSLMDSRGEIVISVLCVTYEVGLNCCTIFPVLLIDSAYKLQVELVPESDTAFLLTDCSLHQCLWWAEQVARCIPSD